MSAGSLPGMSIAFQIANILFIRMGYYVDGVKFAGGSFSLFPEIVLRDFINICHSHGAYVSTVSTYRSRFAAKLNAYRILGGLD